MKALAIAISVTMANPVTADPPKLAAELAVGLNVRGGTIEGERATFEHVSSVVAWSRIRGASALGEATIEYVWSRDRAIEHVDRQRIHSDPVIRTSRSRMRPGAWTVELRHDGKRLGLVTFTVR